MTDRSLSRHEAMGTQVGRALRFANATFTNPAVSKAEQVAATVTVLADHDRHLRAQFGPCYAEEAKQRGWL